MIRGSCAKFLAYAAAAAGTIAWGAVSFVTSHAAGGAGNAVGNVAAKIGYAVGLNVPVSEPGMVKTSGAATVAGKASAIFTDRYESRCTSFTQSLGCSIDGAIAVAAGSITIVAIGCVFAMATGLWGRRKHSDSIGVLNKQ